MSDFDKEAEREKLREKYEQDEEKRKTTEQMSELLLKGATMTNAHCGDCGDPIFRYDGQEFCPTCQKPVDRGTDKADADAADEGEDRGDAGAEANGSTGSENIEVASPSDEASVQFGAGDDATEPPAATAAETDDSPDQAESSQTEPSRQGTRRQPTGNADDVQQVPSADPGNSPSPDSATTASPDQAAQRAATPSTGTGTGGSAADHLAQAQLTLAKTVERHARLAAAADSPRETRDHLETAREAAETLDATDF